MDIKTLIFTVAISATSNVAFADDIGGGKPTSDPDATPPGTVTESCTSTVDCALQELIELFTESREM